MSKKKLAGIITGCVIVIAAIAIPFGYKPVADYSTLMDYLYGTGEYIMGGGIWSQSTRTNVRSTTLLVREKYIYVSEYPSGKAMIRNEPEVSWGRVGSRDTVYFYRTGRLQVMYIVGFSEDEDDKFVMSLLEDVFGKPCKVM